MSNKVSKNIMIQGTCSNTGKSIITAGLCRIFTQEGHKTAPFKSQNMALNSFVTIDGLEMGRAQVTQAMACKVQPDVRMNPILLKPATDTASQVIVMGKPLKTMEAQEYYSHKKSLKPVIKKAFKSLSLENDIIVIEGAGSPAELNLKKYDLVNMYIAKMANSPVIIVGDIDRGGIFASLIGTYNLLPNNEKDLIAGFIINKFRGDKGLFHSGVKIIERKTNKKVLGVVPYIKDLNLPEEDSVEFKSQKKKKKYNPKKEINIALIDLPHISNFTDFLPFENEKDVNIFIPETASELIKADGIIIPGSKNVIYDLDYLKTSGLDRIIIKFADKGKFIAGICGGYQMMGKVIKDPYKIESKKEEITGLGLLNVNTILEKEKQLNQVTAKCPLYSQQITGYEIHHGKTSGDEQPFILKDSKILGYINKNNNIWGSYIHGIFDNDKFRRKFIDKIRIKKGLPPLIKINVFELEERFNILADTLRKHVDINYILKLIR